MPICISELSGFLFYTMQPRQHQIKPIEIGVEFLKQTESPQPSIIVAPTAFGKSVLIALILNQVEGNVLILQPNIELLKQNHEKYFLATGERAAIYSASAGEKSIGRVTFATIGSIVNIGQSFEGYKMIIDECHLYPRNSQSMFGKFIIAAQITHVLGLTATPFRLESFTSFYGDNYSKLVMLTSGSKKGNFFKNIIYVSQIQEIVQLGFWAKLEYKDASVIDQSQLQLNSTGSDFTDSSINEAIQSNGLNSLMLKELDTQKDRKKVLVFCFSVHEAIAMSEITPNSAAVYGDMDSKDRKRIIHAFKDGSLRVIFNVNVLSVGFDSPNIDCIIMGRPTASLAWYYQVLGRGTRLSTLKENCLIVDFSGNLKRFGKIENFRYAKKGTTWKMYGENDAVLTGIDVRDIGTVFENKEKPKPKGDSTLAIRLEKVGNLFLEEDKKKEVFEIDAVVQFGKYQGSNVSELPKHYIEWCLKEFDWKSKPAKLKKAMDFHFERLSVKNESVTV